MTTFEDVRELQTVNVARTGGVARIALNRPDALNAWDEQLGRDLRRGGGGGRRPRGPRGAPDGRRPSVLLRGRPALDAQLGDRRGPAWT